jgi:alkylation response protein AidB-like acyl-CoA dehydrogenase
MQAHSPSPRSLVGTARAIAAAVTARTAVDDDRDARWPEPTVRALADARLTAVEAPAAVGAFSVVDHGPGIPEADRERGFESSCSSVRGGITGRGSACPSRAARRSCSAVLPCWTRHRATGAPSR